LEGAVAGRHPAAGLAVPRQQRPVARALPVRVHHAAHHRHGLRAAGRADRGPQARPRAAGRRRARAERGAVALLGRRPPAVQPGARCGVRDPLARLPLLGRGRRPARRAQDRHGADAWLRRRLRLSRGQEAEGLTMDRVLEQMLGSDGGMTAEDIKDCSALAQDSGQGLDRLRVATGYLTEAAMLKLFGRYLNYPYRQDLRDVDVPKVFVDKVPVHFARSFNVVGVEESNGTVQVATCAPYDLHPIDDLATMLGKEVDVVL